MASGAYLWTLVNFRPEKLSRRFRLSTYRKLAIIIISCGALLALEGILVKL
jgi:hypothetical protein